MKLKWSIVVIVCVLGLSFALSEGKNRTKRFAWRNIVLGRLRSRPWPVARPRVVLQPRRNPPLAPVGNPKRSSLRGTLHEVRNPVNQQRRWPKQRAQSLQARTRSQGRPYLYGGTAPLLRNRHEHASLFRRSPIPPPPRHVFDNPAFAPGVSQTARRRAFGIGRNTDLAPDFWKNQPRRVFYATSTRKRQSHFSSEPPSTDERRRKNPASGGGQLPISRNRFAITAGQGQKSTKQSTPPQANPLDSTGGQKIPEVPPKPAKSITQSSQSQAVGVGGGRPAASSGTQTDRDPATPVIVESSRGMSTMEKVLIGGTISNSLVSTGVGGVSMYETIRGGGSQPLVINYPEHPSAGELNQSSAANDSSLNNAEEYYDYDYEQPEKLEGVEDPHFQEDLQDDWEDGSQEWTLPHTIVRRSANVIPAFPTRTSKVNGRWKKMIRIIHRRRTTTPRPTRRTTKAGIRKRRRTTKRSAVVTDRFNKTATGSSRNTKSKFPKGINPNIPSTARGKSVAGKMGEKVKRDFYERFQIFIYGIAALLTALTGAVSVAAFIRRRRQIAAVDEFPLTSTENGWGYDRF